MGKFYLKAGDTGTALQMTLKNPDGSVHDLTGEAAYLHISLNDEVTKLTRNMTIVDAANGVVQYPWVAGDWGTGADKIPRAKGIHLMEVEALGAKRTTFPNKGFDSLVVEADIADGGP